ncbi:IS3 family transposase, partial (plasmid) [Bacillus amyloliquefaciens]
MPYITRTLGAFTTTRHLHNPKIFHSFGFHISMNHKTVQRIMQKNQWQCRVKVKKRKKNGQPYAVAENILDRNFQYDRPLEKLVTDITYLPY